MKNKKVIIAMSGGVDSSTAAIILKNKGFEVQGIFLDFFNNKKNIREVEKIAKKIRIPLKIISAYRDFDKKIINYFLDELAKGNTPNPCVTCNKEIKFYFLLNELKKNKADFVATGHYALKREIKNQKSKIKRFGLFRAKDNNKDQSYFLYKLTQSDLSKITFPLGKYTKVEVRESAKKFGLPVHDKKESQDICFIPEKGYENFLKEKLRLKKGKIFDLKGNILGEHEGLPLYTIGQRKGIKIGGKGPYYVAQKDFSKNRLIVSGENDLFLNKIKLKNLNWINKKPKLPFKTMLRTRYRNPLVHAIINSQGEVIFSQPQKAVTSGQAAVFYSKNGEVIGGGTII